jgi:hypothetical protein
MVVSPEPRGTAKGEEPSRGKTHEAGIAGQAHRSSDELPVWRDTPRGYAKNLSNLPKSSL